MKWKFDSCPRFEEQTVELLLADSSHSGLTVHGGIDFKMVGSEELSRLWNQASSLDDYGTRLLLSDYLEPLKEQMADANIEAEYRMSEDPVCFSFLRINIPDF